MKPQLGYWNIRGLGAPIRMLLHYCDVTFDDVRYEQGDAPTFSLSAWLDRKHTLDLELPNLPYFIDEHGGFVQTIAIMHHIAAVYAPHGQGGLGHDEPRAHMMAQAAMDLRNAFVRCSYGSRTAEDVALVVAQSIAPQLATWNELMASGRPYCTGDKLTFADFFLAEHIDQIRLVLPEIVRDHKALHAYVDRFFSLERNRAFVNSSLYSKWPVNNKSAFIGAATNSDARRHMQEEST